nr:unnamed protein product [Digitaria exilis]
MASVGKKRGVPALGWWLMVVGTVRLAFTCSCFFGSAALCSTTYSKAQSIRPIYTATFLSLVYAYGHFIFEYLVFHTVRAATLAGLGFFAAVLLTSAKQR